MAQFLESITELVECAICQEELTDPRILSCHHSFCLRCLSRVLQHRLATSINCPTCRSNTKLPGEDVTKLPVDFRAVQINRIVTGPEREKVAYCQVCSAVQNKKIATPASAFCEECSMLFCKTCTDKHRASNLTSQHAAKSLLEAKSVDTCRLHGNAAKWFCLECSVGVCFTCTVVDEHRGHEIQPPQKASMVIVNKVNKVIAGIKRKCQNNDPKEEIKRLKTEETTIKFHCLDIRNKIKEAVIRKKNLIEINKHQLFSEVQRFEDSLRDRKNPFTFIKHLEKVSQCESSISGNANACNARTVYKQAQILQDLVHINDELEATETLATQLPHVQFSPMDLVEIGQISFGGEAFHANEAVVPSTNALLVEAAIPKNEHTVFEKVIHGINASKAVILRRFSDITNLMQGLRVPAYSGKVCLQNLKWNMMIQRNQMELGANKALGVFLQCDRTQILGRKCHVEATITLRNQAGLPDLVRKISHNFKEVQSDYGYWEFISVLKLLDPNSGFVKDDQIVVEIQMAVRKPVHV